MQVDTRYEIAKEQTTIHVALWDARTTAGA